jgi:hypothetical protein
MRLLAAFAVETMGVAEQHIPIVSKKSSALFAEFVGVEMVGRFAGPVD